MKKKSKSASQFPNIYRLITESLAIKPLVNWWNRLPNQSKRKNGLRALFTVLLFVFLLVLITQSVFLSYKVYKESIELKKTTENRQKIVSQINFWQSVLQKYPGYKDAYFKIAILDYQLKNFNGARENLRQALLLDPNYTDAQKLEEIIDKNYSAGFSSGF